MISLVQNEICLLALKRHIDLALCSIFHLRANKIATNNIINCTFLYSVSDAPHNKWLHFEAVIHAIFGEEPIHNVAMWFFYSSMQANKLRHFGAQ